MTDKSNKYQHMKTENKKITSFSEHLDVQYGKSGTETREKYEEEYKTFELGIMLQEMRKKRGLTQEQLALKCGTTKTYISKIENNVSDIRLSTLMRIIRQGLGGHLNLSVDI
jgi:HTH-type transcriptional regulator / antitoxin HipB